MHFKNTIENAKNFLEKKLFEEIRLDKTLEQLHNKINEIYFV